MKQQRGFTVLETLIGLGVVFLSTYALASVFKSNVKQLNYAEFQGKKEQLRAALVSQVLNDPNNCRCMFDGAYEFPANGTPELEGALPQTSIGRYAGANCNAAIISPLASKATTDSIRLKSLALKNIFSSSGVYSGSLEVTIEATKELPGPRESTIQIPVSVATAPGSSMSRVAFKGCSMTVVSGAITAAPTNPFAEQKSKCEARGGSYLDGTKQCYFANPSRTTESRAGMIYGNNNAQVPLCDGSQLCGGNGLAVPTSAPSSAQQFCREKFGQLSFASNFSETLAVRSDSYAWAYITKTSPYFAEGWILLPTGASASIATPNSEGRVAMALSSITCVVM